MNNLQQMELLEQEQECFLGNLYEQSSAVFMDFKCIIQKQFPTEIHL